MTKEIVRAAKYSKVAKAVFQKSVCVCGGGGGGGAHAPLVPTALFCKFSFIKSDYKA